MSKRAEMVQQTRTQGETKEREMNHRENYMWIGKWSSEDDQKKETMKSDLHTKIIINKQDERNTIQFLQELVMDCYVMLDLRCIWMKVPVGWLEAF